MDQVNPFKWRRFEATIILLCVRWYLRYSLSYRDLEAMIAERSLHADHTTIYRWVQRYAPEFEQRVPAQRRTADQFGAGRRGLHQRPGVWDIPVSGAAGLGW
jgi:transposase, IS6 family